MSYYQSLQKERLDQIRYELGTSTFPDEAESLAHLVHDLTEAVITMLHSIEELEKKSKEIK